MVTTEATRKRLSFLRDSIAKFDESKVTRDHGRFASGGGSSGAREPLLPLEGVREISPKEFAEKFKSAFEGSPFANHVTHYSEEQLKGMRLFTDASGKAGIAVHDHGDGRVEATALFSQGAPKGTGVRLLQHVIDKAGVNYVECYGPKLNQLYSGLGFKMSTKDRFNKEYAAPGWSFKKFDSPNYYTMRLPK